MKKTTFKIKGMHCASCASIIEKTLSDTKGVNSIAVNYGTEQANIEYDEGKINENQLNSQINKYGYELLSEETRKKEDYTNQGKTDKIKELKDQKNKLLFVFPISLLIFFFMMWEIGNKSFPLRIPEFFISMEIYSKILLILSSIVLFWLGKSFLNAVLRFVKYRVANMDTLVGIGVLTAYLFSTFLVLLPDTAKSLGLPEHHYFDVTIIVISFICLGKYLEAKSKLQTGEAVEKLIKLQVKTALVERDGKEMEIDIKDVRVNDIIIVKPGSKIPVDGVIIGGYSSIDESMITGEPIPVDKVINDTVIGGTINKYGFFRFKAKKIGTDTLLSSIIKMVQEAQGSKAPIQKLADKISSVFVPIVLIIAVLTLLIWLLVGSQFLPFSEALSYGLLCFVGVLVIACPCALGLATPTAIIVGVGKGAENGILIKNAESLEKLHKVNTVVMDKTGTITKGKPEVTNIFSKKNVKEILTLVASLENKSEHPLAKAVVEKSKEMRIKLKPVKDFTMLESKGISGIVEREKYYVGSPKLMTDLKISFDKKKIEELSKQGKTPILFSNSSEILAIIAISDSIKDVSKQSIARLHKLGINVVMLTGDNRNTAEYIANQVGVDKVFSEVLPDGKAKKIKELQSGGFVVAMAGDGINDAPALAQSDVGIAMGTGTDIAIDSADIILLSGDIQKIPQAILLSKKTMLTIKENLFWAFIYNIIGIPLAAGVFFPTCGILLNPIFAGLAMAMSSVSVVSNSLRLKLRKI